MKPDILPALPPSLRRGTIRRIPRQLLDDAAQEAWAAHLAGADANAAVWKYVKRTARRERRVVCFSQLDPKVLHRIYCEMPER
jgi:hypothetical protein